MNANDQLSIGDLARRTGLSASAIRFYEDKGLIHSIRTAGNQRRFLRSDIRRLSFILIVQKLGLSLEDIGEHLRSLPQGRTPSSFDWWKISEAIRESLDRRIEQLQGLRDNLDGSAPAPAGCHPNTILPSSRPGISVKDPARTSPI